MPVNATLGVTINLIGGLHRLQAATIIIIATALRMIMVEKSLTPCRFGRYTIYNDPWRKRCNAE
jgi:hypothetical protein